MGKLIEFPPVKRLNGFSHDCTNSLALICAQSMRTCPYRLIILQRSKCMYNDQNLHYTHMFYSKPIWFESLIFVSKHDPNNTPTRLSQRFSSTGFCHTFPQRFSSFPVRSKRQRKRQAHIHTAKWKLTTFTRQPTEL